MLNVYKNVHSQHRYYLGVLATAVVNKLCLVRNSSHSRKRFLENKEQKICSCGFGPINLSTKYATGWGVTAVGGGGEPVFGQTQDSLSREFQSSSKLYAFGACCMAVWLPKEQTAHLALKESQPYARMTFFHSKTTTITKATLKIFLFQIEHFRVSAGFKQSLLPPAPVDQRSISDLARLWFPLPSCCWWGRGGGVRVGGGSQGETGVHLKQGGNMGNPGSAHCT